MEAFRPIAQPDDLSTVEGLLSQLEHLEDQLQQVRDGLTQSHRLATLGTITSIIAHEYNNILTPMISYAQLALNAPDDRDLLIKAVEKALSGALRATQISQSLLGFAREADDEHAASLPKTIDEAVACMARDPRKDGVKLDIDVPDVRVGIGQVKLQQVILNLLLNARKAMRGRGGSLKITGATQGSLVQIDVADTGPGIPPQIKDRLFEPFVTRKTDSQADPADDIEPKGTGLGLSICRDLVHEAGGSITVDSTPGQGATFHITLPIADELLQAA